MSAEVQQEQLEPCRVALTVNVSPEVLQKAFEQVFNQFAKRATVPGFRPGKAPKHLLKRVIDEGQVREMALERAMTNAYRDAVRQSGITPYTQAQPKVELVEGEEVDFEKGFNFKATIATEPVIELGDVEGLKAQRVVAQIGDEDVERELEQARESYATYKPTEEGAEQGDRIRAVISVSHDGEPDPAFDDEPRLLQVGTNLEAFDAGLEGIKADEERTFEFTYPDDFPDEERRGKTASATVKALEVLRRSLPELDDEFAQQVGAENAEELRNRVREALQAQAEALADQEVNETLIREFVQRSTVNFPDEMVDIEVSDRIGNLIKALERRGLKLEDYLQAEGKELTDLQAELAGEARETITNTLVLLQLAREHNLGITNEEVEAEVKARAEQQGVRVGQMRRLLEESGELDQIRNRLFIRKITGFLREKAEIETAEG